MKTTVIDMSRGLVVDTVETKTIPRAGQFLTLHNGISYQLEKVRKNHNKGTIEVYIQMPLLSTKSKYKPYEVNK